MFGKKTVDGIIADIVQKIEHLYAVAEAHHAATTAHLEAARVANEAAAVALKERDRAKSIAEKLTGLVS